MHSTLDPGSLAMKCKTEESISANRITICPATYCIAEKGVSKKNMKATDRISVTNGMATMFVSRK
jgi:hypothetical protein